MTLNYSELLIEDILKNKFLGFEGTPLILLWRGKQQRALNKEVERENIELIQKD